MQDQTIYSPRPQTSGTPPPSGSELADAPNGFAAIKAVFDKALARNASALRQFHCLFAGRTVLVRTVGRRLGEVAGRALAHLEIPGGQAAEPVLYIDLWDGAETATAWQMMAVKDGLGIDYWFSASADQRYVVMERLRELTWFDRQAKHIVGFITNANELNLAEQARLAYFPVLLWLHDLDIQVVHSGLVAENGSGVLLAGETGHGKSTTSLACLMNGLDFLSDDHVWIESTDDDGFLGHTLYASVNLKPDQLDSFNLVARHAIVGKRPAEQKSLVFLHPLFPERIKSTTSIRAVVVPRIIQSAKSRFSRAPKAEAALAMVRNSMVEWAFKRMPNAPARFQRVIRVLNSVPCFYLELGQNFDDIARCLRGIIREVNKK